MIRAFRDRYAFGRVAVREVAQVSLPRITTDLIELVRSSVWIYTRAVPQAMDFRVVSLALLIRTFITKIPMIIDFKSAHRP